LEQQTDLIVRNIQVLLQAMRTSNFGPEFQSTITGITTVVSNLIIVANESLQSPSATSVQKSRGLEILDQLNSCNTKLIALGEGITSGSMRPSKQKLAAAAYEVAKFTKELVSLFDLEK
jgi:hypothetical protein